MLTWTPACDWLAVRDAPARLAKTIRNSFLISLFAIAVDAAKRPLFKALSRASREVDGDKTDISVEFRFLGERACVFKQCVEQFLSRKICMGMQALDYRVQPELFPGWRIYLVESVGEKQEAIIVFQRTTRSRIVNLV